ncbi:MAG: gamma-glutamyl-gamma-aminobutyrate hydrolase family protein [Chloroflexota bacterium]
MPPPLIGLTVGRAARENEDADGDSPYVAAVNKAAGIPVLVPYGLALEALRTLFDRLDGLVLTGGGDIDPRHYGSQPGPRLAGVDAERDQLELTLARWAVEAKKPILGICRGQQLLNVALGGTLIQDIPSECPQAMEHDAPEQGHPGPSHVVRCTADSLLCRLVGQPKLTTNSYHHQAVARLGRGLTATATTADGIIEGIELRGHPFALGVQWHPELMPDAASTRALFTGLTRAAARR